MDHRARIVFLADRVVRVVMDTVAVEGERRVLEQCNQIERHFTSPDGVAAWRDGRGTAYTGTTIDEVMLLNHCQPTGMRSHLVAQRHEDQRSSAALFASDSGDDGSALRRHTDGERTRKREAAARPHAVWQPIDLRQHAAAPELARIIIGIASVAGLEVKPMRERRQVFAVLQFLCILTEEQGKANSRRGVNQICEFLAAPHPCRCRYRLYHGVVLLHRGVLLHLVACP